MNTQRQQTVKEIALQNPASVRVFESFGIDYCCGGKRPLEDACRQAQVDVETVLAALSRASNAADAPVSFASLTDLTQYIVNRHHLFVRQEVPRLAALLKKVRERHGAAHPELEMVEIWFEAMAADLIFHMQKEERVLFPALERMEQASGRGEAAPAACFGSVEFPIRQMMLEHDEAGESLRRMRAATAGFTPPEDACASFRALFHGLDEFERDLHRHVHLENNLLFPRAIEMEKLAQENAYAGQHCLA